MNPPPMTHWSTLIFATFESEFAPLGGLAAVMRVLPKRMAQLMGTECLTIAPFFRKITRCKPALLRQLSSTGHRISVPFGGQVYSVELLQAHSQAKHRTILLKTAQYFNAPCNCQGPPRLRTPCNPYVTPGHPEQLLRDALFFCQAVPHALVALGYTSHLIVNLQDWETACVAFTLKRDPRITHAACVLTLHNSYDHDLPFREWRQISSQRIPGKTVLTKMLPFLDGPLCTVSEQFARELRQDPLHTKVYAPHLQTALATRPIRGIDNGAFAEPNFPLQARRAAMQGHYTSILTQKRRRRARLIHLLEEYQPSEAWGSLDFSQFDGPIFLMFGRDDPRQKGYDLAAAAIEHIPAGEAKFVFTPIPGEEGSRGLQFLKRLAGRRPGDVKVFPFRMERGYAELQAGASFLLMCSFYEPFGGATEGYAVGTPVVARATGGLIQQVVPYPSACCTPTVRRLSRQFHKPSAHPTGFLFREPALPSASVIKGWRAIIRCRYRPHGDRLRDRLELPLFQVMAQEAARAIQDAIALYRSAPIEYARMVVAGFHLLSRFSWDRTVSQYRAVYRSL
ncbi:MAG: hypothetical protein D6704_13225 [Nitrospirae bacterium]|nr:MAG: hypothetical protein D6704_13225 [Nitrospirota bacterium]